MSPFGGELEDEQTQYFDEAEQGQDAEQAVTQLESQWEHQLDDLSGEDPQASWMESWEPVGEEEIEFIPPKDFKPGDAKEPGKPWSKPRKVKAPDPNAEFVKTGLVSPRAEVREVQLLNFAVDRYELQEQHRKALRELAKQLKQSYLEGHYAPEQLRAYAYGEASSTAGELHNLKLSRHRAYNTLKGLYDALKEEGIAERVIAGYYGTGEQRAVLKTGQNKEDANYRGALLRLICPLAAPKPCPTCKDCPPPKECPPSEACPTCKDTGGGGGNDDNQPRTGSRLCFSIANIERPKSKNLLPAVVPLNPFLPALKLPVALVLDGNARVKVTAERGRGSQYLDFKGWGLELALPSGRHSANLQVDLRIAIELIGKHAVGIIGKVVAGPLAALVGIDVSVVGRMVASLALHLKARLELDFKSPGLSEPSGCTMIRSLLPAGTPPNLQHLNGTAFLIVPGRGFGAATLLLKGDHVSKLRLERGVFQLPADKSNVRTLLALGGQLKLAQVGSREAEFEAEALPAEWPESLLEVGAGNFQAEY